MGRRHHGGVNGQTFMTVTPSRITPVPDMVLGAEQGLHTGLLNASTQFLQLHQQNEGFRAMRVLRVASPSPFPRSFFNSSFQASPLVLQAFSGINVLTFPVDVWPGQRNRVWGHTGYEGAGDKGPRVRFRAQLNCPELSFLFSRKCIIQEPPTALAARPAKQSWNVLPFPLVIVFSG